LICLAATSTAGFDRLEIEASLDCESRSISGITRVRLGSIGSELQDLRFRLYPNRFCDDSDTASCGVVVDSILVDDRNLSERIVVDGTDLTLMLPESVPASDTLSIELYFTTVVPEKRGRFGFYDGQFTLEGWFPIPAPWRDTGWLKVDYGQNAEPVADLYDITATIQLPDTLQVIAGGIQETDTLEGTQVVKLALCPAQDLPLIAATGYKRDDTNCGGIIVTTYYTPNQAFALDTVRHTVCRTLQYMSDNVMVYPFKELIVVMGGQKGSGAVELPRMVLMSERESGFFTRIYQATLIHEVIHQWFFGALNSDQANEPWLDESITEYFTERVNRWMVGDGADFISLFGFTAGFAGVHRMISHSFIDLVPIDRPAANYAHQEYYGTVYCKGAMVLKTMTAIMGKERERQFWREYTDRFLFSRPTPSGFVEIATRYMPTDDTAAVSALISTVASLDFAIRSVAVEQLDDTTDSAGDSSGIAQDFRITVEYTARQPLGFPVDFRIEYSDGSVQDTVLDPAPGTHRLTFRCDEVPVCVMIDPEYKYAIDMNLINNSYQLARCRGAGLRLFSGVMFLVESLFSMLWGI